MPVRVTRDEALRDDDLAGRAEARLQLLAHAIVAARREKLGTLALVAQRLRDEQLAGIEPYGVETDALQVRRAERRRRELARREDARVHSRAHLADQAHAGNHLLELLEQVVEKAAVDAEIRGQIEKIGRAHV